MKREIDSEEEYRFRAGRKKRRKKKNQGSVDVWNSYSSEEHHAKF